MRSLIGAILPPLLMFGNMGCRSRHGDSDQPKEQRVSAEVPKPRPTIPTAPPSMSSPARLGPAVGATLVSWNQFWQVLSREYDEHCGKMRGGDQYYMHESPDAPYQRLESRRQRFLPLTPKGEFETTQEYQQRVKTWRIAADAAIEAYLREFNAKLYSTYFPVDLLPYDADRGVFSSIRPRFPSGGGRSPFSPAAPGEVAVPLANAQRWRAREEQLLLRADYHITAYCGPIGAGPDWTVVRWTLVFPDSGEILWFKEVAQ